MRVLAINCGSSSLKCSLIDTANGAHLLDLRIERIGVASINCWWYSVGRQPPGWIKRSASPSSVGKTPEAMATNS